MTELTIERLHELLKYDYKTGEFHWKENNKLAGIKDQHGFLFILVDEVNYSASRLAWFYFHEMWPKSRLYHKNGIKGDNRIDNLIVSKKYQPKPYKPPRNPKRFQTKTDPNFYSELKSSLSFDKETGKFFWIKHPAYSKLGQEAGFYDKRRKKWVINFKNLSFTRESLVYYLTRNYWPSRKLIHKNGDNLDDRFENLELKC